jgi:transposase-like protein
MTVNHHPKVAVHAVKSSSDALASQGARRATEEARASVPPQESSAAAAAAAAAAEVVPHARRRQFSNADKRRILDAADRCTRPGEVGALMRREGVYSSSLSTWRRQREAGDLASLAPQKRGPKIPANRAETLQITQLTRERDGLRRELDKAMLVIGVQKKLATLLDTLNNDNSEKP